MGRSELDASDLEAVLAGFSAGLTEHQQIIDRLNVYPVPDGDTGTNMLATVNAVMKELSERHQGEDDHSPSQQMDLVCSAIAHGALMGARGNSGVILCQILRGLADEVKNKASVGGIELVRGLDAGARAARDAVLRPVEGTILSVATSGADAAAEALGQDPSLHSVVTAARQAALEALWATPSQLAVLSEAGVVDAGGAGLMLFYDAMIAVVDGTDMPTRLELPEDVAKAVATAGPSERFSESSNTVVSPRYEVMYLLEAPEEAITAFKNAWSVLGDSIVVVGGDGLFNCHIHADDIGAAIEVGLDIGRPREIRVTDLSEQVQEERWVREAAPVEREEAVDDSKSPMRTTAVVAVAAGEGIGRIFRSLGVAELVVGGQSMNPSTAEILEAIEHARGEQVVVLPNNSNIIAVAREAARLATKFVFVLPIEGAQEACAALMAYDPKAEGKDNATKMELAAEHVVAGDVTRAIRGSKTAVGEVHVGDWIGLSREGICVIADDLADATCALVEALTEAQHEVITIIEGDGASEDRTRRVVNFVTERYPHLLIERHHGGQPLYPYLLAIE